MKSKAILLKSFLGIATLLTFQDSAAQSSDKWLGTVELNPVFSTQSGADPMFNVNFAVTRRLNDYIGLGAGIGIEESFKFKGSPMLPVFARIHAEDYNRKFSPYFNFDIGYEKGFGDNTSGMLINPTVGIRYDAFSLGIGYRGFKSHVSGSKMASAISVNLAYTFGFHRPDSEFIRALRKLEFSMSVSAVLCSSTAYDISEERTIIGTRNYTEHYEVGTQSTRSRLSYKSGGNLTLALTYPVYRNLYVGIAAGATVFKEKSAIEVGMDFLPGTAETYWGLESYQKFLANSRLRDGVREKDDTQYNVYVAARLKYKLREFTLAKRFFPYVQMDLGGFVASTDNLKNSVYFSPEIGMSMAVGSRHSLDLGIGYTVINTQKYSLPDKDLGHIDPYSQYYYPLSGTAEYGKSAKRGAFKITLGYTF